MIEIKGRKAKVINHIEFSDAILVYSSINFYNLLSFQFIRREEICILQKFLYEYAQLPNASKFLSELRWHFRIACVIT